MRRSVKLPSFQARWTICPSKRRSSKRSIYLLRLKKQHRWLRKAQLQPAVEGLLLSPLNVTRPLPSSCNHALMFILRPWLISLAVHSVAAKTGGR